MKLLKNLSGLRLLFLTCLLIFLLSYLGAFRNYELIAYDARLKFRAPLKSSPEILLIEISEDTLKNLGKWPLPRDFHAAMVKVLQESGARQIIFDILFSETQPYDEAFTDAINSAGNVWLALAFYPDDRPYARHFPWESQRVLAGISPALEASNAVKGHINIVVDPDGKIRRAPLFIKYANRLYPNLGLSAALERLGLNSKNVRFAPGKVSIDNKLILPVTQGNSFLVNYPDRWVNSFRHLSYFQILKSYSDMQNGKKPNIDLSILKGKTCFIGLTATGTVDLRPTPLESVYPMLGLQASIFNSILNKEFIYPAGLPVNSAVSIILFIFSLILCLCLSPWKSLFANTFLSLAFLLTNIWLFVVFGLWLNLFFPLFIVVTTYIGCTIFKLLEENKKRLLLENELNIARNIQQSFLPKNIESFPGLSVSCFLQPAKFVAGDLYDIAALDRGRLGVFIGDVAGKGVSASLIMAQTISLFRVFCRSYASPSQVLSQLNQRLFERLSGRFVTCTYIIIDMEKKNMVVSCAGHPPFLILRQSQDTVIEVGGASDMPLGLDANRTYSDQIVPLESSDKMVLFTDGIIEARNKANAQFGMDNLKNVLLANRQASSSELMEKIKEKVFGFSADDSKQDDISLIIISCEK